MQAHRETASRNNEQDVEIEETTSTTANKVGAAAVEAAGETIEDIDKLLSEIDEVLEKDAQALVDSFVQRGGQ